MKTLSEELNTLEQKTADERAHLARKHAILALLPIGDYAEPSVHSSSLYGSVGSINWNQQRYASIATGKSPDPALLAVLLNQFPPVAILKRKESCTSFIPEPESYTNNGEYLDIDPVTVDIDPSSYAQSIKVEWYALLPAGDMWCFKVELPMHPYAAKLGRLSLEYVRMFGRGEITRVKSCDFSPIPGASRVRWTSGDNKTPNRFTIYWERGHNVSVPELLAA